MEIIDYLKKCVFENYANFSGRARRREYWYFCLAMWIINMIMQFVSALSTAALLTADSSSSAGLTIPTIVSSIMLLISLAVLIPSIAVCIRRLHDIGKSGLYLLLSFIPLVGGIILLIWFCRDSEVGANKWGPNPKNPTAQNEVLNAFK